MSRVALDGPRVEGRGGGQSFVLGKYDGIWNVRGGGGSG